jgi:hypothetical protein
MPLTKLHPSEVAILRGTAPIPIVADYAAFLGGLAIGEGGLADVARGGATRSMVKQRIQAAADLTGIAIVFRRSPPDVVVFEVVDPATRPRRPGQGRPATS